MRSWMRNRTVSRVSLNFTKTPRQRLEDLERDRTQTVEDLRTAFQRDQLDAATQLDRDLADADSDEDRERARERFNRRIQDLTREFHRDIQDLQRDQAREREAIARRAAAQEIAIAERAQARLQAIATQETQARGDAQTGIANLESQAGVSFEAAQANYVATVNQHEQALAAHTAALQAIAAQETADTETATAERAKILQESFDATATAGMTLSETLSEINTGLQAQLGNLDRETAGTIGGLQGTITAAEARTGLSFEQALQNYTPAVDLNTQALNTLNATLSGIDAETVATLSRLDAAGITDRTSTTAAQAALETEAGVSIGEARANFVPALSTAAQATLTLNTSIQSLEQSFRETIQDIHTAGLVDRQAVDAAVQAAIADAQAQQTALESQAGVSFADASAAFQPGISDIARSGVDRDTTLADIDAAEGTDIEGVNAQALADRLETDAQITAARDAYIKARDQQILQHNTAILQLNQAEATDIAEVKATLIENLVSIDAKLDTELEEIRAAKDVFDTRIGDLIDTINSEANTEISTLNADTQAMRLSLEALAEEARDNAWKEAILKIANAGITVAGVAAGAAVGNPQAGLAVGQVVGGLVEQGGNELFHFEQTDAIARRIARQETLRRRRETPSYLPDANQIRNARDVSREIVAGVTEGLNIGGRGGQIESQTPTEFNPTIVINLDGEQIGTARMAELLEDQQTTNRLTGRNLR